jgi:polyisoprenoid-binding protein YceI
MKRHVMIGAAAAVLVIVLFVGGAYAYFFSGLRTTPRPLALTSPEASPSTRSSAAASTQSGAAPSSSGLAGAWTVGSGSQAGYRVSEQFAGQSSTHEAVARTSSVTGGLTAQQGSGGYQVSSLKITVQLTGLQSVDQVVGFNVTQRDRIVQSSLSAQQYPDAIFQASSVTVPAAIASGQTVTLQVPGQLTIHGTTRDVVASVQAHTTSTGLEAAGSIAITMTDYGVNPPQVPITTVQPGVTIEFQIELSKAS